MKLFFYILCIFLFFISNSLSAQDLSESQAFTMIFGNYNSATKSSNWIHIPFPNKQDVNDFWEQKRGIVKSIFFQPFSENGNYKFFLLTKTTPIHIPFDCHACLPLISAFVFVKKQNTWQVEAKNLFVMFDGEYGISPVVQLIPIGKEKFGLTLVFEHHALTNKELTLLIPFKNNIVMAHHEIIYSENFNDCEFSNTIQCVAYVANLDFYKSKKTFYDLHVKRFGTFYSNIKRKTLPLHEEIIYKFLAGTHSYYKIRQSS